MIEVLGVLNNLIIYWPVALIGASTGLIGWLLWVISISVANTRWRKAIQNGRYADKKMRDFIREQKARIIYFERENAFLVRENTKYKNMTQSVLATIQRVIVEEK